MDEPPSKTLFVNIFLVQDAVVFAGIAVLLFLTALISASEAAFFSLQSKDLDSARRGSNKKEHALGAILEDPRLLWVTLVVMNILIRMSIVTIATVLWAGSKTELPLKIISITLVIVLVGDLIPKIFASQRNVRFALACAFVWRFFAAICKPIYALTAKSWNFSSREMKAIKTNADVHHQTKAVAAGLEGTSEGEQDFLKGIANFGTLTVRQVMRSRNDISAVDVRSSFDELMDYVNKSGFSRIPVCENTLDSIVGVLYIKDLLPFLENQAGFKWQSLLRPGLFVKETKKIDLLLKDFQEKRVHMAIVTGQYGGTVGLVTLEDLIEEIIGEINDEFDEIEHPFKKIDNQTFLFDAKILLRDFCKTLDVEPKTFDEVKGKSETLGGLILELNKEIPLAGDQINYEQFTFVIESMDRKSMKRVRVKVHEQA